LRSIPLRFLAHILGVVLVLTALLLVVAATDLVLRMDDRQRAAGAERPTRRKFRARITAGSLDVRLSLTVGRREQSSSIEPTD
jgi:hypothetical protein